MTTIKRRAAPEAIPLGRHVIPSAFGNAVRYTAPVIRSALIWFAAYLGVAGILLLARAFST